MDYKPLYQYNLAKELAPLRKQGVLIIGSGNMVHNLAMVDWFHPESGYEWAIEANSLFKQLIIENNHQKLINYKSLGTSVQRSIPTPEHYLPLIYALAVKNDDEKITFFNDKLVMGSLSMTSLIINDIDAKNSW